MQPESRSRGPARSMNQRGVAQRNPRHDQRPPCPNCAEAQEGFTQTSARVPRKTNCLKRRTSLGSSNVLILLPPNCTPAGEKHFLHQAHSGLSHLVRKNLASPQRMPHEVAQVAGLSARLLSLARPVFTTRDSPGSITSTKLWNCRRKAT